MLSEGEYPPLDMRPETINPYSKESRYMSHRWILCLALTPLVGLPASAQSVISAHSGLIHFSEGSVFLDDQRVEQKTGKFGQMNNGSELRTQEGRAEVLLTPGTVLASGREQRHPHDLEPTGRHAG